MLPEKARYDAILALPKGTNLGKALINAMDAIEEDFEPLKYWRPPFFQPVRPVGTGEGIKALIDTSAHRGEKRTLVTGVRFTYTLPFPANRVDHGFSVAPTEDVWCYPNDDDFIGELVVVVTSQGKLRDATDSDASLTDMSTGATIASAKPVIRHHGNIYSAVYKWSHVLPGQRANLMIRR